MEKKLIENWKRHTMIWLTEGGRNYVADHIYANPWEQKEGDLWKKTLIGNPLVPGIICRQPEGSRSILLPNQINTAVAGFSSWKQAKGSRLRMAATFPVEEVWKVCAPFDLCTEDKRNQLCNRYPILEDVFSAGDQYGVKVGLFGSTALEFLTGYPYRNQSSDLDLYVKPLRDGDLKGFGEILQTLEQKGGIPLDAEVELDNGYGVKLKELLSPSKTVLGKGLYDVKLFRKNRFNAVSEM